MKASSHAVVAAGGVLRDVHSEPPLTLRQVHAESPSTCALRLVGSAAGPLSGDDLTLDLTVLSGARAELRAIAASLAQGRTGQPPSSLRVRAAVRADADLVGDTGPLVVAAGARTHVEVEIAMESGAHVDWQEIVVLGRTGEPGGQATLRWDVTVDGDPLLRQVLDLTDAAPLLLAGNRVIATNLLAGPSVDARTCVLHPTAVATRLGEHAVLLTVLAPDTVTAAGDLAALRASLSSARPPVARPA